jgi:ribose 5-phosphate isomerase RpiB
MSIAANKVKGIRAALCKRSFLRASFPASTTDAKYPVHGRRVIAPDVALAITDIWLDTPFVQRRAARGAH